MIKKIFFLLLATSLQLGMGQEPIRFRQIAKKEGLSNNTVFAIEKDGKGFMWFGTRNGLNRYDGYRLEKFYHLPDNPQSIVSNDVRELYYDSSLNCLWIGTEDGLSQLSLSNFEIKNYLYEGGFSISGILRTNTDQLLVSTNQGLYQFTGTDFKNVFLNEPISSLYKDRNGNIWITGGGKMYISKPNGKLNFEQASNNHPELQVLSGIQVNSILEDSRNNYWFGTDGDGLYCFNIQKSNIQKFQHNPLQEKSLSNNRIRSIKEIIYGDILIGTAVGLNIFHVEKNNFQRILNDGSSPQGLRNNSIRSIFTDDFGGTWVGTYYRGVNYTNPSFNRFHVSFPFASKLNDDHNIISAIASEGEEIWLGTEGSGIAKWNDKNSTFKFLEIQQPFGNLNVKSIFPEDQNLWVGTFQQGLLSLNDQNQIVNWYHPTSEYYLPSDNIYDIQKNDTSLMLASYGGGLIFLNTSSGKSFSFLHDPDDSASIISNDVRLIYKDHDGDSWLGTVRGISRLISLGSQNIVFENTLTNKHVFSITSVRRGEIWIGTFYDGLYRLDKETGTSKNYSTAEGLPGNTVYSILVEGEDLWLSTDNGIVKFKTSTEEFINFGNDVELKGIDYSLNSSHVFNNKLYLFGSNSGLLFFDPKEINPDAFQPPLVLSSVEVLGEKGSDNRSFDLSKGEELRLEYNSSNVEIEFASLDFTNPANNKYAFRMKGIDNEWIYTTGEPYAIYTLQREGDYTFEFKASNSDGIWNSEISQLKIHVAPPWFRSQVAYIGYVLFFLSVLYVVFRLIKLRNSYKVEHIAKIEQERSHQLKTRFFTNITHELRTPLTLMLGPLQDIIGKDDIKGPIRSKLEGVQKNVIRLSHLVNQLLDFRKLETDHMKMQVVKGDIIDLLKEIYFAFREETTKRNIDFIFESENDSLACWYDSDKIEKVFFNLLSNALKFTPDSGLIKIIVSHQKDQIKITVQDNGQGIDESSMDQIFERFYERNPLNYSNYGAGIGLALSKQLVELHHGTIYAENNDSKGTSFIVELQKGSEHFTGDEAVEVQLEQPKLEKSVIEKPENKEADSELHTDSLKLLIVEDDYEIREYLKSLFSDEYEVLLANDGKQGFDIARNKIPDLIISDIMMPVEDGIAMCGKIKTTLETSHIPVILLTARAATPFKIGGLETGADDYITKPFNSDELILKTKNIISARKAYLDKLSRTHDFQPDKIAITSTDEKFLNSLMEITEKNMENSGLSVEQLADELHVSRALLFTKIKSLTGKTPKGFIKDIRLKRAAQLLEDTDLNVSQVAYKSGFKDYRYFTKVFKKQYGISPKEYSKVSV